VLYFSIAICPRIFAPVNGMISCQLRSDNVANPGETCQFSCDDGFTLTGSSVRTCQNDRTWSGTEPMCVAEAGMETSNYKHHLHIVTYLQFKTQILLVFCFATVHYAFQKNLYRFRRFSYVFQVLCIHRLLTDP